MLLVASAWALGTSGLGVPVPFGPFAGPVAHGGLGMAFNPAAAATVDPQLVVDLGGVWSKVDYTLEGAEAISNAGWTPIPSLALTAPAGRWNVGLVAFVPFGREGEGPADGPQRFHVIESGLRAMEADLAVAWTPWDAVSFGGAVRVAALTLTQVRAVDTGMTVASALHVDDPTELLGDPFLEGVQEVPGSTGVGVGGAFGVRVVPARGWVVAGAVRSPLWGSVRGPLVYTPSNALQMQYEGRVTTRLTLPPEVSFGVRVPLGIAALTPELAWTGWSSWARLESVPEGLSATSDDPVLASTLDALGTTVNGLVEGVDSSVSTNGTRDTTWFGVGLTVDPTRVLEVRAGVYQNTAAVPDAYAHPANLDFASTDLRAGLRFHWGGGSLGVGGDVIVSPQRTITTSLHDPTNDPATGLSLPSGNGTYRAFIGRVGLTWVQNFRRRP